MEFTDMSYRALRLLRSARDGRLEMTLSREADLRVDSLLCCDQSMAHRLVHCGLIEAAAPGSIGDWVPARITDAGRAVLMAHEAPALAA
jgi:hypothetical protein